MGAARRLNLREAELARPAAEWLRRQGCQVWAEVPAGYGAHEIDLVGRREGVIIAIELKRWLTKGVIHQAWLNQDVTSDSWCVVGAEPAARSMERAERLNLGVAVIRDGELRVILFPGKSPGRSIISWRRNRLHNYLDHMAPGDVAGRPKLAGEGQRHACTARLRAYLQEHGRTTWARLYEVVPNHYCSADSFASAMREVVEGLRA